MDVTLDKIKLFVQLVVDAKTNTEKVTWVTDKELPEFCWWVMSEKCQEILGTNRQVVCIKSDSDGFKLKVIQYENLHHPILERSIMGHMNSNVRAVQNLERDVYDYIDEMFLPIVPVRPEWLDSVEGKRAMDIFGWIDEWFCMNGLHTMPMDKILREVVPSRVVDRIYYTKLFPWNLRLVWRGVSLEFRNDGEYILLSGFRSHGYRMKFINATKEDIHTWLREYNRYVRWTEMSCTADSVGMQLRALCQRIEAL